MVIAKKKIAVAKKPAAVKKADSDEPKKSLDRTSSERSRRFVKELKSAGGAVVMVRLKTAQEVLELDALRDAGEGTSRAQVLCNVMRKRYASKFKKAAT